MSFFNIPKTGSFSSFLELQTIDSPTIPNGELPPDDEFDLRAIPPLSSSRSRTASPFHDLRSPSPICPDEREETTPEELASILEAVILSPSHDPENLNGASVETATALSGKNQLSDKT